MNQRRWVPRDKDAVILIALLAPAAIISLALWMSGLSPFWGDLTYLHHPWRTLVAEMIQQGELPLWNPYAYLGMPLAAEMQCAAWYPGSIPFHIFPFALGLVIFHAMHYGLGGIFTFLWLRNERLSRVASFAGAVMFIGCGSLVSRVPFLNHLSTLAYMPAFLLLRRQGWLLGLAFALSFLSGYPLMMAGSAAIVLLVPAIFWGSKTQSRAWIGGAFLGAGIGACLLLPALELAAHSHRGAGLGLEDTLMFGLNLSDWRQWISPLIVPAGQFSPSIFWWKTCYLGIFSWVAIGSALTRLNWRTLVGILIYLIVVGWLLLGGSTTVSHWVWAHAVVLRYVRYPGNLAYLLLPVLCFLVAAGVHGRTWAPMFAVALGLELLAYAVTSQPLMPSRYYTDKGPLVRELQQSMDHRYHISPNALNWGRGEGRNRAAGILDFRQRLYGLMNLPFHLSATVNFGEPLVPTVSYAYMDFIYSRSGLDAAALYLAWSDASTVLTRDRLASKRLNYDGKNIWHLYRVPGPLSRARWFDETTGSAIPKDLVDSALLPDFKRSTPLRAERPREDHFWIRGRTDAGWAYVAEPRIEGWGIRLNGRCVYGESALGAFQKFHVPAGEWELRFRYAPISWIWGLSLTCLVLFGATAYWYNRILIAWR